MSEDKKEKLECFVGEHNYQTFGNTIDLTLFMKKMGIPDKKTQELVGRINDADIIPFVVCNLCGKNEVTTNEELINYFKK